MLGTDDEAFVSSLSGLSTGSFSFALSDFVWFVLSLYRFLRVARWAIPSGALKNLYLELS